MKLLVIDGNSILNRAFYGIRLLTTKDGRYTNAVYGFFTMLLKIMGETQFDSIAVAFDMRAPTFRHEQYSGYKANRKGMPPELAEQLPLVKELLNLLGYNVVECEGYEADDIIGTLAVKCKEGNGKCVIATGDRDSLQLVDENVTVRLLSTNKGKPEAIICDEAKIFEDYGVSPAQLIDIKAIQGDSSDNIPGIQGIGEKGARDLIQKFGSLDGVYENIDSADIRESLRAKLKNGKESAYLSRTLGEICKNAPVDTDLSSYIIKPCDSEKAVRYMAELELFSLIDKMSLKSIKQETIAVEAEHGFTVVENAEFSEIFKVFKKKGKAFFVCDFINMTVAFTVGKTVYSLSFNLEELKPFFEDSGIRKYTHDSKKLYSVLDKSGTELSSLCFDTLLAAYLLNPSSPDYSLRRLFDEYNIINTEIGSEDEFLSDASRFPYICEKLEARIQSNGQATLLNDVELPLAGVLAGMENTGFMVDKEGIEAFGKELSGKLEDLESEIYEVAGCVFNINSPKQLGIILFEKLNLPYGKKTKTGYSTSAEVLEQLEDEHPVVKSILLYRALAKLKSTYCDGLLKVIAEDGRIHTSFNQTETRTGRISSTEPNLQNIPIRTETGSRLREFFIAKEGCLLIDADYSQIELRVLAHLANDETMLNAFAENMDIHTITASQVFNMPPEMVTPVMRSRAKAVNFGIVYGIGAFSLAKDIGVSRKQADGYIKSYLAHYSGIDRYMQQTVQTAKDRGYAETVYGRRRALPELTSSNFQLRSFGERVARNMPIQGTAADIIKIAMIRVEKRLKKEGMRSRLILQVHDELIVEAPADEAMHAAMLLQEEMENAAALKVPLLADASVGKTWLSAKM